RVHARLIRHFLDRRLFPGPRYLGQDELADHEPNEHQAVHKEGIIGLHETAVIAGKICPPSLKNHNGPRLCEQGGLNDARTPPCATIVERAHVRPGVSITKGNLKICRACRLYWRRARQRSSVTIVSPPPVRQIVTRVTSGLSPRRPLTV